MKGIDWWKGLTEERDWPVKGIDRWKGLTGERDWLVKGIDWCALSATWLEIHKQKCNGYKGQVDFKVLTNNW